MLFVSERKNMIYSWFRVLTLAVQVIFGRRIASKPKLSKNHCRYLKSWQLSINKQG